MILTTTSTMITVTATWIATSSYNGSMIGNSKVSEDYNNAHSSSNDNKDRGRFATPAFEGVCRRIQVCRTRRRLRRMHAAAACEVGVTWGRRVDGEGPEGRTRPLQTIMQVSHKSH